MPCRCARWCNWSSDCTRATKTRDLCLSLERPREATNPAVYRDSAFGSPQTSQPAVATAAWHRPRRWSALNCCNYSTKPAAGGEPQRGGVRAQYHIQIYIKAARSGLAKANHLCTVQALGLGQHHTATRNRFRPWPTDPRGSVGMVAWRCIPPHHTMGVRRGGSAAPGCRVARGRSSHSGGDRALRAHCARTASGILF